MTTAVLAAAIALGGPVALAPAASAAPTVPGPVTGAAGASGSTERGELRRLVVEPVTSRKAGAGGAAAAGSPASTAWLQTSTGRIPIDEEAVRHVPTGSTVDVRLAPGSGAGGVRRVESVSVLVRASSTPRTAAASAVHSVTVVLALPAGVKADGATTTGVSRTVTGGASSYWSRASGGRFTFTVTKTVGWTRLSASCSDVWSIWDAARARAGFVPGPRRHLLVYVPAGAGCPTGLATVGTSADTGGDLLVGGVTTGLIAHELGHNLGLGHSDALACGGASDGPYGDEGFGGSCRRVPYGDWYDVMGISWDNLGSLSTAHAYRLGLLGAGAVTSVRGPARVTLRPVSGRAGLRSLRVADPAGGTYVVEFRPSSGADAWIGAGPDWHGLRPGVLVRRVDPEDATQTLLLDGSPPSSPDGSDTDAVLRSGRPVTTASGRVSFVVESVSPGAVTVAVVVDGVWPVLVVEPRGRLVGGRQVTVGEALASWGSVAF